jgi:hypothetical protein
MIQKTLYRKVKIEQNGWNSSTPKGWASPAPLGTTLVLFMFKIRWKVIFGDKYWMAKKKETELWLRQMEKKPWPPVPRKYMEY